MRSLRTLGSAVATLFVLGSAISLAAPSALAARHAVAQVTITFNASAPYGVPYGMDDDASDVTLGLPAIDSTTSLPDPALTVTASDNSSQAANLAGALTCATPAEPDGVSTAAPGVYPVACSGLPADPGYNVVFDSADSSYTITKAAALITPAPGRPSGSNALTNFWSGWQPCPANSPYSVNGSISGGSSSSAGIVLTNSTTATPPSSASVLLNKGFVNVSGSDPAAYSGTFPITAGASGTVSVPAIAYPGLVSAIWTGANAAKLSFPTLNNVPDSASVTVSGSSIPDFNGTFNVTGATNHSISVALTSAGSAGDNTVTLPAPTAVSWLNGVATVGWDSGSALPSGVPVGSSVTVSGAVPSGYNGTFIVTHSSPTNISFDIGIDPGNAVFTENGITGMSWAGGTATVHFAAAVTAPPVNALVSVAGAEPSGYDVTNVAITSSTTTSLSYAVATDPGSLSLTGTGMSWTPSFGGRATLTFSPALDTAPPIGATVNVSGAVPNAYNGAVTVVDSTVNSVSYDLAGDPGQAAFNVTSESFNSLAQTATFNFAALNTAPPVGTTVTISGSVPDGYNVSGAQILASSTTSLTVGMTTDPGQAVMTSDGANSISYSGGNAVMTFGALPTAVPTGASVTISGAIPSSLNGSYLTAGGSTTSLSFAHSSDMASDAVTNATWDSGSGDTTIDFATVSEAIPAGASVTISGVTPAAFDGTFTVLSSDTGSVTYGQANPGTYVSGGTLTTLPYHAVATMSPFGDAGSMAPYGASATTDNYGAVATTSPYGGASSGTTTPWGTAYLAPTAAGQVTFTPASVNCEGYGSFNLALASNTDLNNDDTVSSTGGLANYGVAPTIFMSDFAGQGSCHAPNHPLISHDPNWALTENAGTPLGTAAGGVACGNFTDGRYNISYGATNGTQFAYVSQSGVRTRYVGPSDLDTTAPFTAKVRLTSQLGSLGDPLYLASTGTVPAVTSSGAPIAGQALTITFSNGSHTISCAGLSGGQGYAKCTFTKGQMAGFAPGSFGTVEVNFTGNSNFLPGNDHRFDPTTGIDIGPQQVSFD